MPHKNPEDRRRYYNEYHKGWYQRHRETLLERAAVYRGQKRAELGRIMQAAKDAPCMDCGNWFDPACMEFDHRDPATKVANVSKMRNGRYPVQALLDEIAKCDLVCANCHRIRTKYRAAGGSVDPAGTPYEQHRTSSATRLVQQTAPYEQDLLF